MEPKPNRNKIKTDKYLPDILMENKSMWIDEEFLNWENAKRTRIGPGNNNEMKKTPVISLSLDTTPTKNKRAASKPPKQPKLKKADIIKKAPPVHRVSKNKLLPVKEKLLFKKNKPEILHKRKVVKTTVPQKTSLKSRVQKKQAAPKPYKPKKMEIIKKVPAVHLVLKSKSMWVNEEQHLNWENSKNKLP